MIIRNIFIDINKCTGTACNCENKCYVRFPELFGIDSKSNKAFVKFDDIPPDLKDQAEWALFYCSEQDGANAGSILGRGEPDVPEPD